jgi:hypothetical protein
MMAKRENKNVTEKIRFMQFHKIDITWQMTRGFDFSSLFTLPLGERL